MRFALVIVATKRSGSSAAIAVAIAAAKPLTASQPAAFGRLQRRDDVQTLAARGLDEAGEPGVLEAGRGPRARRR